MEAGPAPGFALPLVLTMLLLVSLLAAAGHALSSLELRTSETHRMTVAAFYGADGALQESLGRTRGWPEPTRSLPFPGGSATVWARHLLRLPGGERLFAIVSRSALAGPGGGTVRRAVGTVVMVSGPVRPAGALLLLGTLEVEGGSGRLDGRDEAGADGCAPPGSVAGLAALTTMPPAPPPEISVEGDPRLLLLDGPRGARAASGLDWAGLLGPHAPEAAAILPDEPWPAAAAGEGSAGVWPVIRIRGPQRLDATRAGHGAIVAEGDLELADGFAWDGLVLVGGRLLLSGAVTVRGGVAAGLDALVDGDPGTVTLSAGGVDLRYHSCHAGAAAAALALPPVAYPGTWFEELKEWN